MPYIIILNLVKIKINVFITVENVDIHEKIEALKEKSSKLKIGDTVFITTFVDVHNIFVRKVEDDTDEFSNFIEKVNSFCSSGLFGYHYFKKRIQFCL